MASVYLDIDIGSAAEHAELTSSFNVTADFYDSIKDQVRSEKLFIKSCLWAQCKAVYWW